MSKGSLAKRFVAVLKSTISVVYLFYFNHVWAKKLFMQFITNAFCCAGPNRSDPEETEGEEGHDVCCEEIPEG